MTLALLVADALVLIAHAWQPSSADYKTSPTEVGTWNSTIACLSKHILEDMHVSRESHTFAMRLRGSSRYPWSRKAYFRQARIDRTSSWAGFYFYEGLQSPIHDP